jgi:hypothetical protein
LQFWEDSTNSDQRYARNRVRLSVLPQLMAVNARAVQHIAASSELLQAEDELLEALALQELQMASVQYTLLPTPAVTPQQQQQQQQQQQRAAAPPCTAADTTSSSSSSSGGGVATWDVSGLWPGVSDMPLHPSADIAGMFQATVWCKGLQAVSFHSGTALNISSLQSLPRALEARVVRAWLQQLLPSAPTYLAVHEVLGLLQPGQGSGRRTGSLWGRSCVMRHKQLLVLLESCDAAKLHAGELRLERQQQQCRTEQQQRQRQQRQRQSVEDLYAEELTALGTSYKQLEDNVQNTLQRRQQQQDQCRWPRVVRGCRGRQMPGTNLDPEQQQQQQQQNELQLRKRSILRTYAKRAYVRRQMAAAAAAAAAAGRL